jgi:hypothetical protein
MQKMQYLCKEMAIFSDDSAILAYFSGLDDSSHLASPKRGRKYWIKNISKCSSSRRCRKRPKGLCAFRLLQIFLSVASPSY